MITSYQKLLLILLRLFLGWLMFYAGITKIIDPAWSAAGYLKSAKTLPELFQWFLQPGVLPIVNFANEWGLTLLGISLILGVFVRLSTFLGAILMLLYYFPVLQFPYIPPHSYLVDEHMIYALALLLLGACGAGRYFGLDRWCASLSISSRHPRLRNLLG